MNKGLRRVGIVGLSTLVVTSMMSLTAATSFAAAGDYVAVTAPNVVQAASTLAGNVSLDFTNTFANASAQTFQIKRGAVANNCTTAAGVAAAIDFSSTVTATFTGPFLADGVTASSGDGAAMGPLTLTATGSTAACTSNSILDTVTVVMPRISTGTATDTWRVTLTGVSYAVGGTAAVGPVALVTAGDVFAGPKSVNNANVVAVSNFSVSPVITAQSSSTGTALGTASFTETTAAGLFAADADTTVVLTHSTGGDFTIGVLPTVTVPTGWTATAGTLIAASFTFVVHPPVSAAAGTVSVSGLKINTVADGYLVTLTGTRSGGSTGNAEVNAAKVIDFNNRTGGSDRYATAAALFTNEFGSGVDDVVLSSGVNFPDALSANYLAGRLDGGFGTGTLLTKPTTLSPAARTAILNAEVSTVYITGQTGAVSQAVQNQVEALHVGNVPGAPFINVIRLGGGDRFATNKIINENDFTAANTVLLASGLNFPDALALGPIAADMNFPLILTRGVTLGASENTQLADFTPTNVIIAGGTLVVSQGIEDSLRAQGFTVLRLAGTGRTETAQKIATWGTVTAATPFLSTTTYVARGDDFADALAAGPVAGHQHFMIVLTSTPTVLGAGIPAYLGTKTVGTSTTTLLHTDILHALGLTGAVSNATMRAAAVTVGP